MVDNVVEFCSILNLFVLYIFCFISVLKIELSIIDHFAPYRKRPRTRISFSGAFLSFLWRKIPSLAALFKRVPLVAICGGIFVAHFSKIVPKIRGFSLILLIFVTAGKNYTRYEFSLLGETMNDFGYQW